MRVDDSELALWGLDLWGLPSDVRQQSAGQVLAFMRVCRDKLDFCKISALGIIKRFQRDTWVVS